MEDKENWPNDVGVDDERHARLLRDAISMRDFTEHTDVSNVSYAFEIAKWVANHFEYLTYARSDEIDGERLPIAVKALVGYEWVPGGELHIIYPSGSTVDITLESNQTKVQYPSRLGQIVSSLVSEGKTFQEIMSDIQQSIEDNKSIVEEHIALGDTVTSESIKIDWHHPNFATGGLILETDGMHINVLPYGEPDVVSRLLPLVKNYTDDSTELSVIVTEFAILAAEHCPPRAPQFTTKKQEIEQFTQFVADI